MVFTVKEFLVVATSTLFAFAGMLAENKTVLYFCLCVPCLAYLYLCLKHPGSRIRRSVIAIVVVSFFGAMVFLVHRRELTKQQDDAKSKLSVQAFMPTSRNILKTGISTINGANTALKEHQVMCNFRRIVYAPYGGFENLGMQTTLPEKSTLRGNGDGETSYCLAGIRATPPDMYPICADLTVTVSYTLESQPDIQNIKSFRFIASGEDFVYRQQPVEYHGDYCPALREPPSPPYPPPRL